MFHDTVCWRLILPALLCLSVSSARAGDHRRTCYVGFENEIPWTQGYFESGRYPEVERAIRSGIATRCQNNRYLRWWKFVPADPESDGQFPQIRVVLHDPAGWHLRIELWDKRGNQKHTYLYDPQSSRAERLRLDRPIPGYGNEIDALISGAPPLDNLETDLPDWFATAFLDEDAREGQEVLDQVCQGLPIGDAIVLSDPNELQGRLLVNFADFGELTTSWFWIHCRRNAPGGSVASASLLTSKGHHECRIVERNGREFQSIVLRHTSLDEFPISRQHLPLLQQLTPVECVLVKPRYRTQYVDVPCRP